MCLAVTSGNLCSISLPLCNGGSCSSDNHRSVANKSDWN